MIDKLHFIASGLHDSKYLFGKIRFSLPQNKTCTLYPSLVLYINVIAECGPWFYFVLTQLFLTWQTHGVSLFHKGMHIQKRFLQ